MYFKVTNGIETRKFQVTPGQLTFEQLQERLATLFPGTYTTDTSNLVLRYRDSEGDVITLSSDEEFQEVLSDLPEDSVWKLHIASPRTQRQAKPTSFLHHTFEPTWSPFGIRRTLQSEVDRESRELLDLLFGFHDSTSADKPPASAEGEEQAGSKEATGAESVPPQEGTEDSTSSEVSPKNGEEEEEDEVKSKPSASHGKSEEEPPSQCPAGDCCHVKRVGVWEPLLFGGLFGPRRLASGPVGYHITWTPRGCTLGTPACAA